MTQYITAVTTRLALVAGVLLSTQVVAQNPLSQQTQIEIGIGFVSPVLGSGKELQRAEKLRDAGLSYYESTEGVRRQVGKYSALRGYSFNIGFHKPLKKVKGLMLGAMVRNTQTGSTPSKDGYDEGYYFNFITAGVSAKYYPFEKLNLFSKVDFGMACVLTKNRFKNEDGEQNFLHQFGIGSGASLALGYSFTPFKNKTKTLDAQLVCQQLTTRVEVNGIGDDHWKFGAVNFTIAVNL